MNMSFIAHYFAISNRITERMSQVKACTWMSRYDWHKTGLSHKSAMTRDNFMILIFGILSGLQWYLEIFAPPWSSLIQTVNNIIRQMSSRWHKITLMKCLIAALHKCTYSYWVKSIDCWFGFTLETNPCPLHLLVQIDFCGGYKK